jgi:translocation and assembly module TamA
MKTAGAYKITRRFMAVNLMPYSKFINQFLMLLFFTSHMVSASNLVVNINGELSELTAQNITAHLGTLPKSALERSAFIYSVNNKTNNALKALGFYQANISFTIDKSIGKPWQLNLRVDTNEAVLIKIVDILLSGDASNDEVFHRFLKQHQIHSGEPLNHGKYEKVKTGILSLALQRGFFDGELTKSVINIDKNYQTADIHIHFNSGPRYQFGDISFNPFPIEPELLERLIPFSGNTGYSTIQFHNLQQQLQASEYFNSVTAVKAELLTDKTKQLYKQPITVTLTPAKRHKFNLGLGYATDTKFRVSASWRTPLINQYGHFQETKLEYSKINPTGKFVYSIPLSHPRNDLMQWQLQVENDKYSDLETKFYSAQLARLVNKNNWQRQVYIRLHKEAWRYDYGASTANIAWSNDTADYLIPGVSWSKTTRRGNPIDPSQGFRQTYNVEGAHLDAGSDDSFFRLDAKWKYIHTLTTNQRLVTRAELGAIYVDRDADLAPSLLFYAGGDDSIRGFPYQSIGKKVKSLSEQQNNEQNDNLVVGGTRLVIASIEYQYYLSDKWRMSLFSDGGSVANKGEFEPVYSLGSGLHYLSPIGAIKFELAHGVDEDNSQWRLHFNLGAEL